MARTPAKILEPVTPAGEPGTEEQLAKLQHKVRFLWEMVMFLGEFPHYRTGDYLLERADEVARITAEG